MIVSLYSLTWELNHTSTSSWFFCATLSYLALISAMIWTRSVPLWASTSTRTPDWAICYEAPLLPEETIMEESISIIKNFESSVLNPIFTSTWKIVLILMHLNGANTIISMWNLFDRIERIPLLLPKTWTVTQWWLRTSSEHNHMLRWVKYTGGPWSGAYTLDWIFPSVNKWLCFGLCT